MAGDTLTRKTGQRSPLTQWLGTAVGGGIGGAVGHAIAGEGGAAVGSTAGTWAGKQLGKFGNSTFYNSRMALLKSRVADLIAAGDVPGARKLLENAESTIPAPATTGLANDGADVAASSDVGRDATDPGSGEGEPGGARLVYQSDQSVGAHLESGAGDGQQLSGAQRQAAQIMAEVKAKGKPPTKPIGEMARVPELSGKRDDNFTPGESTRFHIGRSRFDAFPIEEEEHSDVAPHVDAHVGNVHLNVSSFSAAFWAARSMMQGLKSEDFVSGLSSWNRSQPELNITPVLLGLAHCRLFSACRRRF